MDQSLAEPVARLLELGEPKYSREFTWPDYLTLGIQAAHIPALILIAVDKTLLNLTDESDPRGWGPVHAWRALGQLHAEEAIAPLMRLFHEVRDNDWVIEEMPDVFALIGPAALPALITYLRDSAYPTYSRMVAATSLMEMARMHQSIRGESIEVLSEQLENFKQNSPGMNGVIIANLVELDAVEKIDLIQKVFSDGKVDRFIAGDWRDIKTRLRSATTGQSITQPNRLAKNVSSVPPDPIAKQPYQEPRTTPRNHRDHL